MNRLDLSMLLAGGAIAAGMGLMILRNTLTSSVHSMNSERKRMVRKGKQLFQREGCNACHSVDGSRNTGPTLKSIDGSTRTLKSGKKLTVDESYLRQSIRTPEQQVVRGYPDNMPSYQHLSATEVTALVRYIRSLTPDRETENETEPAD